MRLQLISGATGTNWNGSAECWWQDEAAGRNPAQARLPLQSEGTVDDGISWWRHWPQPDGDADGGDNESASRSGDGNLTDASGKQRHRGARKHDAIKKSQRRRHLERPSSCWEKSLESSLDTPEKTVGPRPPLLPTKSGSRRI